MSGHITISNCLPPCLVVGCRLETAMTKTLSYYHHCLMSKLACLFTIFNLVPFKHQTLSDSDRNNLNGSQFLSSSRKIPRFFIFCKMKRQNSFYVSLAAPTQPNNIKCLFELQFLLNWPGLGWSTGKYECTTQSSLLSSSASPDMCYVVSQHDLARCPQHKSRLTFVDRECNIWSYK